MINLLDLDPNAFTAFFAERGEKPFRARQVSRWLHQRFVDDVGAMSDLARPLRERLASEVDIRAPRVVGDTTAADGTRKWLIDAGSANAIEAVYIPEDDRGTLCEIMAGFAAGRFPASEESQRAFFEKHIVSWMGRMFADMERATSAKFYKSVGTLGRVFMKIEAEAFTFAN